MNYVFDRAEIQKLEIREVFRAPLAATILPGRTVEFEDDGSDPFSYVCEEDEALAR